VGPADEVPGGDRPVLGALRAAYRGAMTSADAYRAVRSAVRLDRGVLRLGNRFVSLERYREVAFVSLGHASSSMALALWEALGERLTRGIAAGPAPLPANVPFRAWTTEPGPPGQAVHLEVARAVDELAGELDARDLLVVLLSPGALGLLARPPPGLSGPEWAELLGGLARAGASAREIVSVARVLSDGPVGGRLLGRTAAREVTTHVVDRGDGGDRVGGGPTVPLLPEELSLARSVLARSAPSRSGLVPAAAPRPGPARPAPGRERPVVVLSPADGLRGASEALADRRWSCRLAAATISEDPEGAARRLLDRAEEIVRDVGGVPARGSERRGPAGIAVFAGLTLGQVEGLAEDDAIDRFLRAARAGLTRRDALVAALPTAGATRVGGAGAGGVAEAGGSEIERPFAMRAGLTDVGTIAIVLLPASG
jgi:glycerate-2-kinase